MAVTQELAGVGEKNFLQWYFQHKNIHEVNLQLNRTNFKSLSTLPLNWVGNAVSIQFILRSNFFETDAYLWCSVFV